MMFIPSFLMFLPVVLRLIKETDTYTKYTYIMIYGEKNPIESIRKDYVYIWKGR
jgi:hypothetical protein